MSIFEGDLPPAHVERVNTESYVLFGHLRGERSKMQDAFKIPYNEIDLTIAWKEFDPLTFNTIFEETNGDMETLADPSTRSRILSKIFSRWPILYYVRLLENRGIMDSLEVEGGRMYFFKTRYKDSIKTMSTASSIREGS